MIGGTYDADITWRVSITFEGTIEASFKKFCQIFLSFDAHIMDIFDKKCARVTEFFKEWWRAVFYAEHRINAEQFNSKISIGAGVMKFNNMQLFAKIDVMYYFYQ